MSDEIYSISNAASYLGVFPLTLRNWEKKGLIKPFRTPGGHRRYKKSELNKIIGINGTGEKLKMTIEKLGEMILENGHRKTVDEVIVDLRNISEKL